jgi:hypothetical protein
MRIKYILFALILPVLVLGCAKPPLAEMDNAKEAVLKAENDANAVQYARGTLTRAQDALKRMQSEADAKRYDAAKTNAAEAITAAERAISEGAAAAARVREESASALVGLKQEIDETGRAVASARYAQMPLDYSDFDNRIRNDYAMEEQAQADQAAGRYQNALDKGRAVRADLFDINQRISGAVTRKK